MGADPTNTNQTAATLNRIISAENSAGVQIVESLIIADQSWLGFPGIKQILGLFLGWIDGYLARAEQLGVSFLVIETQIGNELKKSQDALAELKAAIASKDPARIAAAEKAYDDAESSLDHNSGSAPPV